MDSDRYGSNVNLMVVLFIMVLLILCMLFVHLIFHEEREKTPQRIEASSLTLHLQAAVSPAHHQIASQPLQAYTPEHFLLPCIPTFPYRA
jgi:hypothetical protein